MADAPTVTAIRSARERLGDRVLRTPIRRLESPRFSASEVILKEELFQQTGSFKVRGALCNMLDLAPDVLARGVTCVSAGNHAIATAYAAKVMGTTAKVVMMKNANPFRVERCRELGATVELKDDVHQAFERVREIEKTEGRTFVHPFEGEKTVLGTATVGLELMEQAPELDAVIVPIGGGGLCAGVAAAVKQLAPATQVFGVEPTGADSMHRSFKAGSPQSIEAVRTIADSLGAPYALPYSFEMCRRFVDDLVLVDDDQLRDAMRLLFTQAKLACEPAGAAATAALLNPLRGRLEGKRVGLIVCGSNIDPETFAKHLAI